MKPPTLLFFGAAVFLLCAALVRSQENRTQPAPISPNDSVPSDAVFEVGGEVIAPVLTYRSDPEYSEAARQARLEGTVLLTIVVGLDGSPRDIKVTRHLGSGLDEKAIETIRRWKFRPGTKDGRPVAVRLVVEVAFHLSNTAVPPGDPFMWWTQNILRKPVNRRSKGRSIFTLRSLLTGL